MTYVVVRYHADGTRDASFDGDGKAEFTVTDGLGLSALAVRSDGKALLVTAVSVPGADSTERLSQDQFTQFDAAGAVERQWRGLTGYRTRAAVSMPGGTVAVAGEWQESEHPIRYQLHGDAPVGGSATRFVKKPILRGRRPQPNRFHYQYVNRAAAQPDGKLLLAGYETGMGRRPGSFAIARFLAGGGPDAAFGRRGVVLLKVPPSVGPIAFDVDVLADGKILVSGVGQSVRSGPLHPVVFRLLPNGRPDPAFGRGGRSDAFGGNGAARNSIFSGVLVQSDGRFVTVERAGADWYDMTLVLSRYEVTEQARGNRR